MNQERGFAMKQEHKESLRAWATLVVSAGALMASCLRQPLAWTLRAAVQDVLHDEFAKYGALSDLEVGREKRLVSETDTLTRMEHEMELVREHAAAAETTHKLLLDMRNSVNSLDSKLDRLAPASRQAEKPSGKLGGH
jgi:hypothetical protein